MAAFRVAVPTYTTRRGIGRARAEQCFEDSIRALKMMGTGAAAFAAELEAAYTAFQAERAAATAAFRAKYPEPSQD